MIHKVILIFLLSVLYSPWLMAEIMIEKIIPQLSDIPDNLTIAPVAKDSTLPEGFTNPLFTQETKFIDIFAGFLFVKRLTPDIQEMAMIAYRGSKRVEELGILVLKFKDIERATLAKRYISYPIDETRFFYLQQEQFVIFIWNDNLAKDTFNSMINLVKSNIAIQK